MRTQPPRRRTPHLGRLVAVLGIALAVLIGIALTSYNQPIYTANEPKNSPTNSPSPLPTTVIPTSTALALPPRPRDLALDRVNPCQILTADQRSALSLDSAPTEYVDQEFDQARACTIRGQGSGTVVQLALVTDMSVNVWLSDEAQVSASPTTVAGWPAIVVHTPGLDSVCNVEVDTTANQFLDVLFRDGGNNPPLSQNTLCQGAQRVAEAAVTSLSRGRVAGG
ncbi:MAG TPA: DUF3558 domain-containing protein [Pseudonocardiaceae bacterium]|jgi:hypothetical protein|nr:DUF3558 domain-containing protein [Pseudonocardiaceae bacterium]